MKRIVYIVILLTILTMAFADKGELASILKDGGFSPSEQKVIITIFDDAIEKGLFIEDLIVVLKENRLKGNSYFETVEDLIHQIKIQTVVKVNQFPYWSDKNIRKIGYYFAQFYTFNQFKEIAKEFREKELKKQDIENFFQLTLFLNSSGIAQNDSFSLIYLLLRNNEIGVNGLDAIKRIILRSKDLKLSRNQVVIDINKRLINKISLKKIINDIEKQIRE